MIKINKRPHSTDNVFNIIDTECFTHIMFYLNNINHIMRVSCACKCNYAMYKRMIADRTIPLLNSAYVENSTYKYLNCNDHKLNSINTIVKFIDVNINVGSISNCVQLLSRVNCASIKNIHLTFDGIICNNEVVREISNLIHGIGSITFKNTDIYNFTLFANCTNVNLSHCRLINDTVSLAPLCNIHTLNLSHTNVINVSIFANVYNLDISFTQVQDVSALGNVHTLDISYTSVRDISALRNNYELFLMGCKYIANISSLTNVHSLILADCNNIRDVSQLFRVNTLYLNNCKKIQNIHTLTQVKTLVLSNSETTRMDWFIEAHSLCLSYNPIKTIVPMNNVVSLYLDGCDEITDFTPFAHFKQLTELHLNHTRIEDVSPLKNIKKISLLGCKKLQNLHLLCNAQELDLSNTNVRDVSAFARVHTLSLCCTDVSDVSMLGNLHKLSLSGCKNITDVSALSRVCVLSICGCSNIRDVSMLTGVNTLFIMPTCLDVSMLRNVYVPLWKRSLKWAENATD